jgi:hypothetical protein
MPEQKQQSGKLVVLHSVISHGGRDFRQGQVIDRADLAHTHHYRDASGNVTGEEQLDAHDRLLKLNAIRPASSEEEGLKSVDVSGAPLALSPLAQAELAAKDATIDRLTKVVGDLQDKVNAARNLGVAQRAGPPPQMSDSERQHLDALGVEKDARIEALMKRLEALEGQTAERAKEQAEASNQAQAPAPQPQPKAEAEPHGTAPPADAERQQRAQQQAQQRQQADAERQQRAVEAEQRRQAEAEQRRKK